MPRTPQELYRTLAHLERTSRTNQEYFATIDVDQYGATPGDGNAAYIITQATEYRSAIASENDPAGAAFAMTEMSRILAICHRECVRMGWDIVSLLQDGVVYEIDVIADYETKRRAKGNRALDKEDGR